MVGFSDQHAAFQMQVNRAAVETTAEVVTVRDMGYGLLTRVVRTDGRRSRISSASVDGHSFTYQTLESRHVNGRMTERGLVLLPKAIVVKGAEHGLQLQLCGDGTCYGVSLPAASFAPLG